MAITVEVNAPNHLSDFALVADLAAAVQTLQLDAGPVLANLRERTLWMVNSTPQGGGVAEMLPTMITLLRDLDCNVEWVVIESDEPRFFDLTKRIHNLVHGDGAPGFDQSDRELFEKVNRENAAFLKSKVRAGDILIVHDPQPMPLAAMLKEAVEVFAIWRCHIGLDQETPATRSAWEFLEPWAGAYDHAIFSAPDYIPPSFTGRATIIRPGIDPLSPKNRQLGLHKTAGVLANAGLAVAPGPLVTPPYQWQAERLSPDGRFVPATERGDFGLFTRPIVTQISRWDRLKGFEPLLQAFAHYKARLAKGGWSKDPVHRVRQELVRLVLAGPDPASIQDDPEGRDVLESLRALYAGLPPAIQDDIAIIALPMQSPTENALMVNAIQRASSIVVQNSLREGFGLTIAEAMWKRVPVLSNWQACGPRQQVRDAVDGRMIDDPTDIETIAAVLDEMLADAESRSAWGRNARRHVHDSFLVFGQLSRWMQLFAQAQPHLP
ncbi:MAG TPA: glycosyltransferase [Gemmatimonadales bacterium]|nr:glycosyltransferase [Gemmatimonadales bacterium]